LDAELLQFVADQDHRGQVPDLLIADRQFKPAPAAPRFRPDGIGRQLQSSLTMAATSAEFASERGFVGGLVSAGLASAWSLSTA